MNRLSAPAAAAVLVPVLALAAGARAEPSTLAECALSPDDTARSALRVQIATDAPLSGAELVATAYRWRTDVLWRAPLPPVAPPGADVTIPWTSFVCPDDPASAATPRAIDSLALVAPGAAAVSLRASPAGDALPPPPLLSLPPFDAPPDEDGWRPGIPADGFGRFGYIPDGNGLLTFTLDADSLFCHAAGDGNVIRYYFGNGGRQTMPWRRDTANSTTLFDTRLLRFDGTSGPTVESKAYGAFDASRLPETRIASILAPGVLLRSHEAVFTIAPEADRGEPRLLVPTAGGAVWRVFGESGEAGAQNGIDLSDLSEGWCAVSFAGKPELPLLVAFDRKPLRAVRDGRGLGFAFGAPRGFVGLGTPFGFRPAPAGDTEALAAACRRLAELLRNYPVRCDMRFRVDADAVEFEERPAFLRWTNEWGESGVPRVPCPPLVAFAADRGLGVSFPDGAPDETGPDTRYGPYRTWRFADTPVARYRLPRGERRFTLPPRPVGGRPGDPSSAATRAAEVSAAIAEWFRERVPGPAGHKTDSLTGWWHFASAATALPLLCADAREDIGRRWAVRIREAFADRAWHVRREPHSGREYPLSFAWMDGSRLVLGDANSGVGAALSAAESYARFTGDWAFVRDNWQRLRRIPLYFLYAHDWTMLTTGAREHTAASAIDMDTAAYEGVAALARLAEALGEPDALATAEMLLARLALSMCAKWHGPGWPRPGVPHAEWPACGIGFSETGFDAMSAERGTPDHVNGEVALNYAWIGCFPDVFRLLFERNGPAFWRDHEYSFVEHRIPDWRVKHPGRRNCHHGNVLPHLYMRMLLGAPDSEIADELARQRFDRPHRYAAAECAGFYAFWLGRHAPVRLLEWLPARLVSFDWDESFGTVRAEFESDAPFRVSFECDAAPASGPAQGPVALPSGRHVLEWSFR